VDPSGVQNAATIRGGNIPPMSIAHASKRDPLYSEASRMHMSDSKELDLRDSGRWLLEPDEEFSPAIPAQIPAETVYASPKPSGNRELRQASPASAGRDTGPHAPSKAIETKAAGRPTNMQRVAGALRVALPFVQRMLPLLDGHVATAVSNVLNPYQQAPPQQQVDLVPIEDGLIDLQKQYRELRNQFMEQSFWLKRVEDQLKTVSGATEANTQQQQEIADDLKSIGTRVNVFAYIGMTLLAVSILLNVYLFLHLRHLLPF
jgi:hypothetical protein